MLNHNRLIRKGPLAKSKFLSAPAVDKTSRRSSHTSDESDHTGIGTNDEDSSDTSSVGIASRTSSSSEHETMRTSRSLRLDTNGNDYCKLCSIFRRLSTKYCKHSELRSTTE